MIKSEILTILGEHIRPETQKEFELELQAARLKGHNVPDMDFTKMIITKMQAEETLRSLGVNQDSLFYQVHSQFRHFPIGQGEELHNLGNINKVAGRAFWEEEYPGFSEEYLELSSPEGEGSYFYKIDTEEVYDASWNEMDDLNNGRLNPKWASYQEFLEWYYSPST